MTMNPISTVVHLTAFHFPFTKVVRVPKPFPTPMSPQLSEISMLLLATNDHDPTSTVSASECVGFT